MNEGEKKVVGEMIAIHCRSVHRNSRIPDRELCESCEELRQYALQRLERCPFGEEKPTCGNCPIHCYKKDMRQKIRVAMRYAGPRMIFLHPLDTIKHFYQEYRRDRQFASKPKPTPDTNSKSNQNK